MIDGKRFWNKKFIYGWLVFVILAVVCVSPVFGDVPEGMEISEVKSAGNITISQSEVLTRTQLREGMTFDPELADSDVEKIAELDGVDYAYYNTDVTDGGVVLTYVVYEKNLVREIRFEGNDKISDTVLSKQIDLARGDYLDLFAAKAGLEELKKYYQKKGYPFAIIELDSGELDYGIVVYKIIENQRVKIKGLSFAGNKVLSDKELKKGFKSKPKKLYLLPNYLNMESLEKDRLNIEKVYQEKGFINASVEIEQKFSDDRSEVDLIFNIREGEVFVVENIEISGLKILEPEQVRDDMKLVENWVYSEQVADKDAEKIASKLKEIGFINAKVTKSREFLPGGKVNVLFDVEPGERFRIGKISIAGNQETNDKVIRRVLDEYEFTPGQWYNADIATGNGRGQLENSIKRETYAESAFITPTGKDPNYRDPLVTLAEGQTGMVMFGAGIGSNDGLVGQVVFEQRNFDISDTPDSWDDFMSGNSFKGAGQKLRIALEPGTEFSRYSINFTEPYLNDKPIQFNAFASSYTRDRDDYDEERLGGGVSFAKRFKNGWTRGLAIRVEDVSLEDIEPDAPTEIFDYSGSTLLAGFRLFTSKTTVDNRYNPSRGYTFSIDAEPVTGDESYLILSATNRWYKTLYTDIADRKTILETRVHGSAISGDAPPFEKFYAGGIGSIRGFEYRGIATRADSADPNSSYRGAIGSDWLVTASSEVAIPMGSGETIAALFFADAAMIDTGGVRASVGTGIQIMIPQFFGPVPMRFELAVPVSKDEEDETQAFSFSIGRLF